MAARLEFILGAAGSGKTTELTRRLVDSLSAGGREWLIVPEQSAVAAESRLAWLTEGMDSSRLEVVNFTRLCNLVFRRLGGLAYNYADAGARTAAMWRTLDELSGLLEEYKIAPENSRRWAQLMLAEYTRLKARGVTPAVLEGAAKRLPKEYGRLAAKLSDLALIGASYSRLLGELYDDPSEDITRATELVRGRDFFAGCGIWLDAFDGFTREQYGLIREMLRSAERVTVALCIPYGTRSPAFDTVRQTMNMLRRLADEVGAEVCEPIILRSLPRYANAELARVAAMLWEEDADAHEGVAVEGVTPDGAPAPDETLTPADAFSQVDEFTPAATPTGIPAVTKASAPDDALTPAGDTPGSADEPDPDGVTAAADAFVPTDAQSAPPRHIRIVECADRYEEAELAAAEIARYVQSGGRWRDCAVIMRNIADYDGIIDAALERIGAPYFMSERTDVASRPVVKLALAALAVVAGGWRRTDIIEMLRTGMAGVSPEECDVLEEYLATWSISGERRWRSEYEWRMNPDGYTDTLTPRGERILAAVNAVRARIVPPLAALADSFACGESDGKGTSKRDKTGETAEKTADTTFKNTCKANVHTKNTNVESHDNNCRANKRDTGFSAYDNYESGNVRSAAAGLYAFLCALDVPKQLEEKEGELAHQLWQAITGALDTIVTVAGSATVSADRFAQIFGTILRQATVGRIPASVDCVMVGQSDRLRTDGVKLVVLLGASEGVFPGKAETGDDIFSGPELQILREAGIDPCDDAEYIASAELFGFYRAAAAPSERLVVTFAPSVSGTEHRPAKPSPGVERLLAMFPGLQIERFADIPLSERVWSVESALEIAVSRPHTPEGAALRKLLSADPQAATLIEAASRPLAEPEVSLSPGLAAEIFRGDLALTQSRLDSYVLCSFGYYCRYMLGLREQPKAEFGGADTGNFMHRVLERFMRAALLPDGRLDPSLTRADRERLADEIIGEYIASMFGRGEEHSVRAQNLFRRLRRTTLLVIENLSAEFAQSEFLPRRFELPISSGGALSPDGEPSVEPLRIPLPDGGAAYVYGKIDRVDTYRRGGEVYLRVVDYKTGVQKFSLTDLALGLNMQLLLYLFSLWNGGREAVGAPPDAQVLPAGIIYMSAGAPRVDAQPGEDAEETARRAAEKLTRTGILLDNEEILRAMEQNLESKYIPVRLNKNGAISTKIPLADIAGFGKLMKDAEKTIAKIAGEMKSGEASARPLREGKHDACKWCPYGAVCRSRRTGRE